MINIGSLTGRKGIDQGFIEQYWHSGYTPIERRYLTQRILNSKASVGCIELSII